jgi:hypothetical protein
MGTQSPTAEKVYPAELRDILERATAGDATVLPELQNAFDAHPELVAVFGDLVEHATRAVLTLAAGTCLTARTRPSTGRGASPSRQ